MPETQVRALPDVDGLDVVELGCGTAYVSAWLARRGARPIGVDLSENQLATARALQKEHGLEFPLLHASAEQVPLATTPPTLSSASTALRCGAIPTPGSPRRRAFCGRTAGSSS